MTTNPPKSKEEERDEVGFPISYPISYDPTGTYIRDASGRMIADVRGWGWIQKLPNPEDTQDAMGEFIVSAINEKIERGLNR